tara:strand:+ start:455 stop:1171 length:717 start_codon:yes stop_codon:yes gene_type:complete
MKYLIANWKMNSIDIQKWKNEFEDHYKEFKDSIEIIVCPNFIDLSECSEKFPNLIIGAQDVSSHSEGSFTGQISAKQLLGASERLKYCIVGHSEARSKGDNNLLVREKSEQLRNNNIEPILCIGENIEVLRKGKRDSFLLEQLNFYFETGLYPKLIAYEPIWAIGTGQAADQKNIIEAFEIISNFLESKKSEKIPLLYGGSVSAENIEEIMSLSNLSGCLVGNSSLDGKEFAKIAQKF